VENSIEDNTADKKPEAVIENYDFWF
jgi:hypothetical protein